MALPALPAKSLRANQGASGLPFGVNKGFCVLRTNHKPIFTFRLLGPKSVNTHPQSPKMGAWTKKNTSSHLPPPIPSSPPCDDSPNGRPAASETAPPWRGSCSTSRLLEAMPPPQLAVHAEGLGSARSSDSGGGGRGLGGGEGVGGGGGVSIRGGGEGVVVVVASGGKLLFFGGGGCVGEYQVRGGWQKRRVTGYSPQKLKFHLLVGFP